jgi:hypothetical protein
MYVFSFSPSATPFCVVNANPSSPSPSSPTLMEDQRERVADASLAFVRRHHLRRLALSLVVLASLHHLSPLHLPPSREGKEDRRPLKWTQNGQKGPASSTPSSARRRRRSHRRRQSARLRRSRRRRRHPTPTERSTSSESPSPTTSTPTSACRRQLPRDRLSSIDRTF